MYFITAFKRAFYDNPEKQYDAMNLLQSDMCAARGTQMCACTLQPLLHNPKAALQRPVSPPPAMHWRVLDLQAQHA